jgi:hypothetical protein
MEYHLAATKTNYASLVHIFSEHLRSVYDSSGGTCCLSLLNRGTCVYASHDLEGQDRTKIRILVPSVCLSQSKYIEAKIHETVMLLFYMGVKFDLSSYRRNTAEGGCLRKGG